MTDHHPEDVAIAREVSERRYPGQPFAPDEYPTDAAFIEAARLAREAAERRLSAPQVDPDLIKAREYVAQGAEARGFPEWAAETRAGKLDDEYSVQAVLRAIKGEREADHD